MFEREGVSASLSRGLNPGLGEAGKPLFFRYYAQMFQVVVLLLRSEHLHDVCRVVQPQNAACWKIVKPPLTVSRIETVPNSSPISHG